MLTGLLEDEAGPRDEVFHRLRHQYTCEDDCVNKKEHIRIGDGFGSASAYG